MLLWETVPRHGAVALLLPGLEVGGLVWQRPGKLQPRCAWRLCVRRLAAWLEHSAVPVTPAGSIPRLFITAHVWSNATTAPHPGTPGFEQYCTCSSASRFVWL